jgi:hypothetical protein
MKNDLHHRRLFRKLKRTEIAALSSPIIFPVSVRISALLHNLGIISKNFRKICPVHDCNLITGNLFKVHEWTPAFAEFPSVDVSNSSVVVRLVDFKS